MKGIFKKYFICPKDKLNYFYNQIIEINELRKKFNSKKNNLLNKAEQNSNYYENLTTHNKKLVKIPLLKETNKYKASNYKKIRSFPKELKSIKNEMSKTIYDNYSYYRTFNSERQLYIKDSKILKRFKKYKDIYEQNKSNFEIVKQKFINDYKNNIKSLNDYLTINDNKIHNSSTEENNINKNEIRNNYLHKLNNSNKKRRIINTHIQLYSNNKQKNSFLIKSNKENNINIIIKTFKEGLKLNDSLMKKEKILFNNYNTCNINAKKHKKLKYYNFLSIGGKKKGIAKKNQDCFLIMNNILDCEEVKAFGVFDGHGEHGDLLSNEIRDMIKDFFSNINIYQFYNVINITNIYKYFSNNNFEKILEIFRLIDDKIHEKYSSNNFCFQCGVTLNILLLFSLNNSINKIISINLGNTKSILINDNNQTKQLNICHIPNIEEERARIEKNGGEIGRAEWLKEGPLRIWYKGKRDSGLSITRSLGDFEVEKLGVNSIPDIKEYDINKEKIKIIILGTEGLWTFLKKEKIMDVVLPYYKNNDIKGATIKLAEIAKNLWKIINPNEISDITVIILYFK